MTLRTLVLTKTLSPFNRTQNQPSDFKLWGFLLRQPHAHVTVLAQPSSFPDSPPQIQNKVKLRNSIGHLRCMPQLPTGISHISHIWSLSGDFSLLPPSPQKNVLQLASVWSSDGLHNTPTVYHLLTEQSILPLSLESNRNFELSSLSYWMCGWDDLWSQQACPINRDSQCTLLHAGQNQSSHTFSSKSM